MLPFYFIKRTPILRKKLLSMYEDRANQIISRIRPFLNKKDKILDIGSGTGMIAKTIKKKVGADVTLLDVAYNEICDLYPVIIYDGKKLPFKNNQFDKSLLIAVLHHASDYSKVLNEAMRVTKGEIIIMEDIFSDLPGRIVTFVGDCLVNWEIHSLHRNHTSGEWLSIFKKKNLNVLKKQEFRLWCVGFPFKLAIFVVTKDLKKSPKLMRDF